MVFKPGIPAPTDNLDDSQVDLQNNFTQLDDTFDIDHVKFSDTTADNGRHKTVTFVQQSSAPTTGADQVISYTIEPTANVGTLQFSRGESDSVPTPVTGKHLSGTVNILAGNTVDTLDFTGLTRAMGFASAVSDATALGGPSILYYFMFDGTKLRTTSISSIGGGAGIGSPSFVVNGNILQLKVTSFTLNNVTWSLNFLRLE